MCRKLWLVVLWSVLLIALSAWFFRERPIQFQDLPKARIDLVAAGYHCTSDRADGNATFGFMVTREPTDWREVGGIVKIGSNESDWHGKVWVTKVTNNSELQAIPDIGGSRVWGNLVAFGDQAFLDEIESTLRRIS